jgi:hypothetical protein
MNVRCIVKRCGRRLVLMVSAVVAITTVVSDLRAENVTTAQVQKTIEGTWSLTDWNIDGKILRPPEVDGRFSLHDGIVMFFLERRSPGKEVFVSGYGSYNMADTNWSYRYEHFRTLLGGGRDTKVSDETPWPGTRMFQFRTEGHKFILDDSKDGVMFIFNSNDFTYIEAGITIRIWKRVPEH